jgi:hypothetical protein
MLIYFIAKATQRIWVKFYVLCVCVCVCVCIFFSANFILILRRSTVICTSYETQLELHQISQQKKKTLIVEG